MTETPGKTESQHWLVRNIRRNFITGLLVTVPAALVIIALLWFFTTIDSILQPIISLFSGEPITGLGFVITIILIYMAGILASNIVGKRLIQFAEAIVGRLPVLRQIYNAAKQAMSSLSGAGRTKAAFREVVLIEFPRKGIQAIAFITNEIQDADGQKLIAIYVPTAPVPTSGYFALVKEEEIIRTHISVDTAMKMVISSGIASPSEINVSMHSKELRDNKS
ncbi:transporter [Dehalogenimonas sp. WBC-2]|nr:transporter [Dehalogenimonas sp. WBC-2]